MAEPHVIAGGNGCFWANQKGTEIEIYIKLLF